MIDVFQAKVVVAEATGLGKENADCTWEEKCQQSKLESRVKRSDTRKLGGKDWLKTLKFSPKAMENNQSIRSGTMISTMTQEE